MSSKIIRLAAKAVQRLIAVEIKPDGNLVQIKGMNEAGKSSVLDSIQMALAGAGAIPAMPVHRGEERAVIEVDLEDLRIRRTIEPNGNTTLTVKNKEGTKLASPQAILDSLMGKIGFDPLSFVRQKEEERYETLRKLAGLDFKAIDGQIDAIYQSRTQIGRDIKSLEGQLSGMPKHEGVAEEETPTTQIVSEWRQAEAKNKNNSESRLAVSNLKISAEAIKTGIETAKRKVGEIEEQIKKLQATLEAQRSEIQVSESKYQEALKQVAEQENRVADLKDENLTVFQERIQTADETNSKIRQNKRRKEVSDNLAKKRQEYDSATFQLETLEADKKRMISKAKLPVPGLSFEAGRVLFDGIPFSQLSDAKKLRISVSVGIALNPKVRVILIRNGSSLDSNNLKLLAEMAIESDAQIWLEMVGTDGEATVVIEDGMVRGAPRPVIESSQDKPADKPSDPPPPHQKTDTSIASPVGKRKKDRTTAPDFDIFA